MLIEWFSMDKLLVLHKKGEKGIKWSFIDILPYDKCYYINYLFIQQVIYA